MARRKCTTALVLIAIVFLSIIVVMVWVQFANGVFNDSARHRRTNKTLVMGLAKTIANPPEKHDDAVETTTKPKSKEFIEKTHLGDIDGPEVIYVKPLKINPDDESSLDLNKNGGYSSKTEKPSMRHHSGHFRHKTAEIWDPHPKYEIDAFGKKLILELENSNRFVAPDLNIVLHGEHRAQSFPHDPRLSSCLYTGKLRGDKDSAVTVSLCHGMTGFIRSFEAHYFIEPAENFTSGSLDTILHRIKKLYHDPEDTNEIPSNGEPIDVLFRNDNGTRTIIEDDFPEELFEHPHRRKKRDIPIDEDILYDSVRLEESDLPEVLRPTRNTEWNSINYLHRENNEFFVKVLVVADRSMLDYHKTHEELYIYIRILMSYVAILFREPSIGNAIDISVVHIRILDYHVKELSDGFSQDRLNGFCGWKQKHTTDTPHDVALLLTRELICRNETSCSTLGVAEVDSMCRPSGCTIVRDQGLFTSYTIAHEFGHVMSMSHDEDIRCTAHNYGSKTNNIMSGTTNQDSKPYMWSACSRYFATNFLSSSRSRCLLNVPSNNEIPSNYSQILPGDVFEIDKQCELEYSVGFKWCKWPFYNPCQYLWCVDSKGACHTRWSPWAEGTKCGRNSWCYKRECIAEDRSQFIPIDGDWGEWQEWGPCTRTCGGGITKSIRICDSPQPQYGGRYCTGRSTRYKSCNTHDCAENALDFRVSQCAQFNGITKSLPQLTEDVQWVPKYGLGSYDRPDEYCRLYCKPKSSSAYYALKEKVVDGTKCGKSGFDICVNGICLTGGCDNQLESRSVLDECGVCRGDNSTCQEVIGRYNKTADQVSYNKVVTIPKGSSNLEVTQVSYGLDENFLALRDGETGAYLLNGNQMLMLQERDVEFGRLIIKYSGSSAEVEKIHSPRNKKLEKDLIVEVLSIKNLSPPNITFRYVISKDAAPSVIYPSRYSWRLNQKQWGKCSSICDGVQVREPTCVDLDKGVEVDSGFCDNRDADPATERRRCNTHCSLTWSVASKSACTPHCGTGKRRIYYNCMKINTKNQHNEMVNEKHCNVLPSPMETQECYSPCNTTRWDYSTWSECSKTCGKGIQRRQAKCVDENNNLIDEFHCSTSEQIVEQICNADDCPVWTVADTSSCSVPCGGGYQNITSYCVKGGRIYNSSSCDSNTRPPLTRMCNTNACGRWVAENSFHPCSVSCGEGIEKRIFTCKKFNSDEVLGVEYCRGIQLPADNSRKCYRECNEITPYVIRNSKYNIVNEERKGVFKWYPGEWSACSQTCDGGISTQDFHCLNEFGEDNHSKCNYYHKPQNIIRCNDKPCPNWKLGGWSPKCDNNCERQRLVRCMDDTMTTYPESSCNQKKPPTSTKCKLSECPILNNTHSKNRYLWKTHRWKQCSTTCGKGAQSRDIICYDPVKEIRVDEKLCNYKHKPKATKTCEKYRCNYAWTEGHWSTCSTTCGHGYKTRNVTCHKVHQGGYVDPNPLPDPIHRRIMHKNYCDLSQKPNTTAKCLVSNCGDAYVWQFEEWRQCSHECGKKGRQTRIVNCISVYTKQKVPRHYCPANLKPPRKRKCNQTRCIYRNCKEIKHYMKTKENKDYLINLQGKTVKIYCYKMDTPEPQEYVTLHPDKENYAEIYDKRLMNLDSCPHDGGRRDNCHCDQITPDRHGFTRFWKVRLNITSMKIIEDDFTFSKQIKGIRVPYGTAGDCYSKVVRCAQGRFSVDLSYTSFKLSDYVRWHKRGPSVSSDIRKTPTLVQGKCGGYCGKCFPDPTYGLLVEIT